MTKALPPRAERRLRSLPHLHAHTKSAARIEEVTDHPLLTLLANANPVLNACIRVQIHDYVVRCEDGGGAPTAPEVWTMTKTAFSYIRCSAKKQKKGDTQRRQLEWGPAICQRKGWRLDESLKLHDLGVSAFRGLNAARGHLAAFLEAIKRKKVRPGDVLLVEALDRLTREDIDPAWELFRSILKQGVEIFTCAPERHYVPADLSNFGTRVEVMAYFLRAHDESYVKSMRGKAYWDGARRKAGEKKVHKRKLTPAWLRLTDDRKDFEVITEAADTIKLIYRWAGEGLGIDPITARLNRQGVKPIGRAGAWRRSYVAKLLRDRSLLGEYQPHVMQLVPEDPEKPDGPMVLGRVPHGDPIADYFPAIISETEWFRVRHAVKERGRTRGRTGSIVSSLFTGLIRDARDSQVMHLGYSHSSRKSNARVLLSYGCRNGEPGTVKLPFPYDPLELAFLTAVRELKPTDITGGVVDDREAEVQALSGKLTELEGKIATVQQRVLEAPGKGVGALVDLLDTLDDEKKAVMAQKQHLEEERAHRQPEALGETQTLIDMLAKSQSEERKELRARIKARIRQLVETVWVLVWDVTPAIRAAEVQILFHSRKVRLLLLVWLRRGTDHRGFVTGIGGLLAPDGGDPVLEGRLLKDYRSDVEVRAWFDQHQHNLAAGIQEAVRAEVQVREAFRVAEAMNNLPASTEVGDLARGLRQQGMSVRAIARELNQMGHRTPHGGLFRHPHVIRLLGK
jgi:DNA invertase Pin-like site-specific DNA recombinase